MYILNYSTGAVQWAGDIDLRSAISMLNAGALISVVDTSKKRALIRAGEAESMNIGWANIPEFAAIDDKEIEPLL